MLGIPLAVAAGLLALVQLILAGRDPAMWGLWWRPVGLLVVGYLLQFIGHRLEGNDVGEIILIKKLLGRPYVAVSPRYSKLAGGTPTPPAPTPPAPNGGAPMSSGGKSTPSVGRHSD
jgi:hypothetical protein